MLYHRDAVFECVSIGVPMPIVYWTRKIGNKYERIVNTSKFLINKANTLHINKVDYDQEGIYACISESPRLKRNVTAELDVYGKNFS